ncbi:ORF6N domain-containing protein [Pasteurella skyensis]|uniref:ORF6N domain-containing protein n=1 Tax=Phocoenobacter skyensis TaxID=97481 RepID=A0AAJ6N824_9PAST|nr:ORF6N domain-containing protein [Pasteurella skyensis]MDP8161750.1 ORF6N domain-containing protein [Pasteurella skyensis]MDP8171906.1 ORF6N domain-containing protein [Pasteurella skyensis]MDP8176143.1 ORF6N domain-containing protein [Pasteurella skyensis]MDP8178161.1 ORF6N domain-containing protein [Pasteurella skyensis]MDP8182231.1 ORF6N domain-containing protein [Pasteurella skyensis]
MNKLTTMELFDIKSKIYTIRDKHVMLDRDLALLYGVETKRINEAVRNNPDKFPDDFYFELDNREFEYLRSKISTTNFVKVRTNPKVFTEQGVYMLATILKSKVASEITVSIIRTFADMRKILANHSTLLEQFYHLEKRQLSYEIKNDNNIDKIFKALECKNNIQEQGVFFNGQIFDAYNFISDLIRKAQKTIILIDNYIDDSTLTLFQKNQTVSVTIYTHSIKTTLKLDLEKYNQQYKPITIKTNKNFHDRFLIIDDNEIYLIGASLKDLGKKVFWFSLLKDINPDLLKLL